jgi:ComF family protein
VCRVTKPAFGKLRAPYLYGGPIKDLVLGLKFGFVESLARPLVNLALRDEGFVSMIEASDALVPIPLSRMRQRQRGFNPAVLLANAIGRQFQIPCRHILKRRGNPTPQSTLPFSERLKTPLDTFIATGKPSKNILLVDDVVTSGATLNDAGRALILAGAQDLRALAIARSDPY